jgi:hypothetical protein
MNWSGRFLKTVFILGAGATRGAFPHVNVNLKRIRAPLNSDFFAIAKKYAGAEDDGSGFRSRYERLRRVFREEFPTRGRWPIPMEEAFSLLYVSKDFPEIYVSGRGRPRTAGSRREIKDFLRLVFGILTAIEIRVERENLYSQLVAALTPDDTIITLNYDTLLDSCLARVGWDPWRGYGLTGGKNKIDWRGRRPTLNPQLSGVKLLKLHGSLNWYVRGSYDQLSRVFDSKPNKVLISENPRTNEFSRFIRQIVPPIYGKFFGHDHWRQLWGAAHEAVTEAEALVVIGCSLAETDFHLTGMLSHAVKIRKKRMNPFVRSALVDSTRVRHRWLKVLRGCVPGYRGFPRFSNFARSYLPE